MNTNLEQAVAYIKAGDLLNGKRLLIQVIHNDPDNETAWLWMSKCVTNVEQKKGCYQRVLKINPNNLHAVEGMHRLGDNDLPVLQINQSKNSKQPKLLFDNIPALIALAIAIGITLILALLVAFVILRSNKQMTNFLDSPVTTNLATQTLAPPPTPDPTTDTYGIDVKTKFNTLRGVVIRFADLNSQISNNTNLITDPVWRNQMDTVFFDLNKAAIELGALSTNNPKYKYYDEYANLISSESLSLIDDYRRGIDQLDAYSISLASDHIKNLIIYTQLAFDELQRIEH